MHSSKAAYALILGLFSLFCVAGAECGVDGLDNTNDNVTDNTSDNTSDNSSNDNEDDDEDNDNTPVLTTEPQQFLITPDEHTNGTDMTNFDARIELSVADTDNKPFELFKVTVTEDGQDYAPSGEKVFAHENIPFFNDIRRLRMDFHGQALGVSIAFAGGTGAGGTEIGRLQVYDLNSNLLAEYVTEPKLAGEVEVMTITRETADIAWAVAYVADNEGSFGRFDDLTYTVNVLVVANGQ